jgi:hypothetical protein
MLLTTSAADVIGSDTGELLHVEILLLTRQYCDAQRIALDNYSGLQYENSSNIQARRDNCWPGGCPPRGPPSHARHAGAAADAAASTVKYRDTFALPRQQSSLR